MGVADEELQEVIAIIKVACGALLKLGNPTVIMGARADQLLLRGGRLRAELHLTNKPFGSLYRRLRKFGHDSTGYHLQNTFAPSVSWPPLPSVPPTPRSIQEWRIESDVWLYQHIDRLRKIKRLTKESEAV